ncbi:cation:proton antiporter [Leptolyngbyaceae cyanobacterium CCMR0082]|uniref:Cation:proton antiporter n=2 Tax=Adonisia turfae TaxID=2950184 RepID=A0A6M0S727_9CYAN|nr:cation:proton antiporter [Adonisia turfae]MDV3349541.1 cation:proton antiporter [Leptothoe sp. LEGE 181152]NEZ55940.1 cation:proton antiporter [Adonisia turfae CCMR0081]NEZ64255.1 cation:proton antiporter [Adonisia turfae CCMR0082]
MIVNHETLSLIWIALPLFIGFSIYLLPKLDRALAIIISLVSFGYGFWHVLNPDPVTFQLLDNFGVSLLIDGLSGFFILTNAVVTTAVILYCWQSNKGAFFYTQAIILHGSVNAVFISADLISVYVALEVISIAGFLLIAYPRTDRSIWVGLRYLFVSNTAMLFYLLGAVLVYQTNNSFAFTGLANASAEAIALIFIGLLTKGGIFVSGLWLPLTHSESESPISALLSGVVVKTGVFPLVRFALMLPEIDTIVRFFGVATALLGVGYAVFSKDTKRILAFHTVSQLGFILAAPAVGGFYALTHGLVKSALFLITGKLSSRDIKVLKKNPIPTSIWVALAIASFSISGFPLLAGFGAKVLTSKNLVPWQVIGMNIAALGTAISFAKFIFLPHVHNSEKSENSPNAGFWSALVILLGGLVLANGLYYEAYSLKNVVKPLITIAAGWLAYLLIFQKLSIKFPRVPEQFDHLIGTMSLMLTFLFWMVLA